MRTLIKFYEGLKGSGVVVSVTYNKSRVIFDFGAPFRPAEQIYDGKVNHRNKNWVKDALRLKQVPPVEGVFAKVDLLSTALQPAEESDLETAILISHLHLDHMSQIGMVHPDIPVFLHEDGYKLELALREVGEEVGSRHFQFHQYHQPFRVGDLLVTSYFSDHPCFGACSYLIETPDQKIFYTGDIRYHGLQAKRAFKEIAEVSLKKIDLLIIDGTTYSPKKFAFDDRYEEISQPSTAIIADMISEEDIYNDVEEKLGSSKNLAFFNIYHRDMQLIDALLDIARRNDRTLVFEPETAYIYATLFAKEVNYYVPDYQEYLTADSILKKMPVSTNEIDITDIRKNPRNYFLQSSYKHILSCSDFMSATKNDYFHLFGEPFGSGQEYDNFLKCLQLFNCELLSYSNLYSFNHAYPNHLSYVIDTIKPTTLVAVHSNNPEKLNPIGSIQFFPEKLKTYSLEEGILKELDD